MLSQLIISQAEANKSLEAKVSELAKSQSELHKSIDDQLSDIAYKQIEQIAEMSDLVDRMSTVERSLQGSHFTGSDPTGRSPTPPGHALMASARYPPVLATLSSLALERSKEEVGFRPLKVIGRPIGKGSVNTTQGQRWNVLEVGENLGQEIIIESHTVGPEVQGIQNPVEAVFPVERFGVAPGVSTGLAPQKYHIWFHLIVLKLIDSTIEIFTLCLRTSNSTTKVHVSQPFRISN